MSSSSPPTGCSASVVHRIRLLGLYRDPSPARMAELVEVLRRTLADARLSEVHVFLEDRLEPRAIPELSNPKVRLVPHGRRLTFGELFAYANQHLARRRVIIANNDIYFDRTLARLDDYDLAGKLLCLSRWEVQADGSAQLFDSCSSQDAWIFQAPIRAFAADWHLGLPGCENRLAYEAKEAGLLLENPARSVRALHLHLSQVRHYRERQRLRGQGHMVQPGWLSGPSLWPVVACMGRLDDLRASFDTWVEPAHLPGSRRLFLPRWVGGLGTRAQPERHNRQRPESPLVQWRRGPQHGRRRDGAGRRALFPRRRRDGGGRVQRRHPRRHRGRLFLGSRRRRPRSRLRARVRPRCFRPRGRVRPQLPPPLRGRCRSARGPPARGPRRANLPASLLNHQSRPSEARAQFPPLPGRELSAAIDAAYRQLKDTIAAEVQDPIPGGALREIPPRPHPPPAGGTRSRPGRPVCRGHLSRSDGIQRGEAPAGRFFSQQRFAPVRGDPGAAGRPPLHAGRGVARVTRERDVP